MAQSWRRRFLRGLLWIVVVYFGIGTALVWTGQWVFRWRVERLLADTERLGRGAGSWGEFQAFQKRWGAWGSYQGSCTPVFCRYDVGMYDWANEAVSPSWVEGWKDPWKYSFPVSYALWPLFRVSHAKFPFVAVVVRVVDGQATPESTMLFLQAQLGLPGNWGLEDGHGGYGLVAGFQMQRGELKTGRVPIPEWPELAPKKDVEVDKPSGCANCLAVYTVFDEKAKASELEPLLRVDTICLTRWHYCSDEASIMPAAWAQYDAEHAVQSAQEKRLAACDYPGSFLYQQAENAVLMRVTDEGDRDGGLKFRYEKRLKGPVELQPGAAYVVSEAEVGPVRSGRAKVGEEMVVLFPGRFSPLAGAGLGVDAYRCGVRNASAPGAGVITK